MVDHDQESTYMYITIQSACFDVDYAQCEPVSPAIGGRNIYAELQSKACCRHQSSRYPHISFFIFQIDVCRLQMLEDPE